MSWLRQSDDFDHHPQVLDAGWHAAQLFQLFLRLSKRFDLGGLIPPKYLDERFIRVFWGCPPDFDVKQAKRNLVSSGLAVEKGDAGLLIDGWDRWNGETSTERVRRFREKKRFQQQNETRLEESRVEKNRNKQLLVPPLARADGGQGQIPILAPEAGSEPTGGKIGTAGPNGNASKANAFGSRAKNRRQLDVEAVYDHWRRSRGKPELPPGKEVFSILGARFSEGATVEQLCRAVDGIANDPWPGRATQDGIPIIFGSMSQVSKFVALATNPPVRPYDPKNQTLAKVDNSPNRPRGEFKFSDIAKGVMPHE